MSKIFYENLNDLSLLQNLIKTMNVSKLKSLNSKFIYASERKRRAATSYNIYHNHNRFLILVKFRMIYKLSNTLDSQMDYDCLR